MDAKSYEFSYNVLRFREEKGFYYTLSPYAKLIRLNKTCYQMLCWCETCHTKTELMHRFMEYYELSEELASSETDRFLNMMIKSGLLEKY